MNFPNWSSAEEFVYSKQLSRSSTNGSTSDNSNEVASFYKSKEGIAHVQQVLMNSDSAYVEKFIIQLMPFLSDLIIDSYANYAMQALIEVSSLSQRLLMIEALSSDFVRFACHPKATHVLQKLVSLCSSPEEEALYIRILKDRVLDLSVHCYGSHVLYKLIGNMSKRYPIVKEIKGHARELAVNKYGVCVINTLINDPLVLAELLGDLLELIQDPYGNYTVQKLLEFWKEEIYFDVICAIKGRVCQLSVQKISSNVIEAFLKHDELRDIIVKELAQSLSTVKNNQFGYYVVKTATANASEFQREKMHKERENIVKWASM